MIGLAIAFGVIVGATVGWLLRPLPGCLSLLLVPIGMVALVAIWQDANPESLRSTSAVDFLFAPLWPSVGALMGLFAGWYMRDLRDEDDV